MQNHEDIFAKIKEAGQDHLIEHYNQIEDAQKKTEYLNQLRSIDFAFMNKLFTEVFQNKKVDTESKYDAVSDVVSLEDIAKNEKEYEEIGLKAIKDGEVAVLLMSGGQGTRLGFDHPKGMFKIGLQSGMTLFEFFVRRLQSLNRLAGAAVPIALYIMTSQINDQQIKNFFADNNYFGYAAKSVRFFAQRTLAALDYNGKIIIQCEGRISLAPQGNGTVYSELVRHGMLEDMKARNVKYVNITAIDNILLKLADPLALGYMVKYERDLVSKAIIKNSWQQKVGCYILKNGKPQIYEYSEMTDDLKQETDSEGKLKYRHSFNCNYFISVDLIHQVTHNPDAMAKLLKKYHIAEKKVTYLNRETKEVVKPTKNTGVKFELFCFDCFDLAKGFTVFEMKREEESASVKNATGDSSPATARALISNLHWGWLKRAGFEFKNEPNGEDKLCEVDARLSYNGEGLESWVSKVNNPVELPFYLHPKL